MPVPDALQPPEIWEGFERWFNDFWELGTDRQIGMDIGPIPKSAIDRHVAGWPKDDAALFRYLIRRLDNVYLESRAEAAQQKQ